MPNQIDSLEVKVQSQAISALNSLDKLEKKLLSVSRTMSTVNGSGIKNMADGIMTLGQAVNQIKSIDSRTFSTLANNIDKLSKIDSNSLFRSSTAIKSMSLSITSLANAQSGIKDISELSDALRKLGYKNVQTAISNMPKLATSINQLMTSLSQAPKVSRNLIDMTNALAALTSKGGSFSNSVARTNNGFNLLSTGASNTSKSFKSLAYYFGKFYANYFILVRLLGKFKGAIDLSSSLTEVQNVVSMTFGQMSDIVDKFSKSSIENFGLAELSAKQFSSRFQAMGSAMGIPLEGIGNSFDFINQKMDGMNNRVRSLYSSTNGLSDMSVNLTKLAADMASFYNVEQDVVAQDLASVFTGMTRPLRDYGLDLTQATLKEWAMKNGLDSNIESMTQAQKTMLRYQYVMANADKSMGDFAKTSMTWANQTRMLKQNIQALGAVWGTAFINMVKPMVTALNQGMIALTNFSTTIVNALGQIFGWKIEIQNVGITQDFEDMEESLGNSLGTAKALKGMLQGFDKLNNLTTGNNGNGSGNSIAGAGSGNGNLFDIVETESLFKSKIKNLGSLGETINEALRKSMERVNWKHAYEGAEDFGTGLADFLNGLISPELFYDFGMTLANTFNTVVKGSLAFTGRFDFKEFGESLASQLNGFLENANGGEFAQAMNEWVDGLEETIGGFLSTFSWVDALTFAGDIFSNLEIDTIAVIVGALTIKKIGKVAIGAALGEWLKTSVSAWVTKNLLGGVGIKELLLNPSELILNFGSFSAMFAGTPGFDILGAKIFTEIDMALTKIAPDVAEFFGQFLLGFVEAGVATGGNPIAAMIGGLFTSFPIKINWFGSGGVFSFEWTSEWFEKAKQAFKTAFDGNQPDIMAIGGWILKGILDGFVGAFTFIAEPIAKFFKSIYDGICGLFGIHSPARNMKPLGENILLGTMEGFKEGFTSIPEYIRQFFDKVRSNFTFQKWSENIGNVKDALRSKWEDARYYWSAKNPLSKVDFSIGDLVGNIKSKWNELRNWWNYSRPDLSEISAKIKLPHIGVAWDTDGVAAKALQKLGLKGFPSFSVSYYANGGFPEDGWFRASHGEYFGQFDNGQSVIANNNQIISGISNGVKEGSMEQNALLREQNSLLRQILEKDTGISENDVFRAVRSQDRQYKKINGQSAFAY